MAECGLRFLVGDVWQDALASSGAGSAVAGLATAAGQPVIHLIRLNNSNLPACAFD